ncbi:anti-sigma factor [Aquipluma nitroreducens]|uniref:Anti-sigma factor n=1 Tax=Aquipluma nitroreducens TaxID=2010828 RepID=A0A5K7S6K6_9BACT|nr:FecR family protein [Aquipluma nitroreducens]BBE17130.1 anti-sigma factor [Aquipluma nitroreducens]
MKLIITKYLRGKSSTEEQNELLHWIRKEEHLCEFQQIKEDWNDEVMKESVPAEFVNDWASIQNRMMEELQESVQRKQRALNFFRYAAILLVIIAVPAFLYFQSFNQQTNPLAYTTVAADYGQISKVVLPDSTVIWVNSGSTIKYNNEFSAKNRDIELIGEAYFKVHKNKDLPLVVASDDLRVKVLGTEFSVSAYPEEKNIQVVLEKGKIELASVSMANLKQEMKPGELVDYTKTNKKMILSTVNTELFTSWKDGIINIYNLPLSDLVIKLEKRYNQKFEVDDEIKDLPYTFTIKNEKLSNILSLMEKITPVDVVQSGNIMKLKSNQQKKLNKVN